MIIALCYYNEKDERTGYTFHLSRESANAEIERARGSAVLYHVFCYHPSSPEQWIQTINTVTAP